VRDSELVESEYVIDEEGRVVSYAVSEIVRSTEEYASKKI